MVYTQIFAQRRPNVFLVQHCTNGIQMFRVYWIATVIQPINRVRGLHSEPHTARYQRLRVDC